jgi:hypothetical protein
MIPPCLPTTSAAFAIRVADYRLGAGKLLERTHDPLVCVPVVLFHVRDVVPRCIDPIQ